MVTVTATEYGVINDVLNARYPRIQGWLRDELVSAGHLGLTKAAIQYDDQQGASFRTYSYRRVWGHMQDALRQFDHLSRAERRAVDAGRMVDPGAPVPMTQAVSETLEAPRERNGDVDLELALAGLDPRHQAVVRCVDLKGWPRKDVGDLFGVTSSRVTQLRTHALQQMRSTLEEAAA